MTLEELKRFAAVDDIRDYLNQPWSRGGYTWASNGHIMVRVPAIEGVAENKRAPDGQALMNKQRPPGEWIPVPECAMPSDTKEECDTCFGTGEHDCPCGTTHECGECKGKGEVITVDYSGMDVGNSHFAKRYIALIQGWEIATNGPADMLHGGKNAAWIRCGDALGLLMPMRKDK